MSFASNIREEIVHIQGDCDLCKKAALCALIRIDGTIYLSGAGRYRVEIATDYGNVGRLIVGYLHDIYNLKTNISYRRSVLHNTQNYQIDVPYQPHIEGVLKDLGILNDQNSLIRGVAPQYSASYCCIKSYLRAVYLASGFVAEPKNSFHFEMNVSSEELAVELTEIMNKMGIHARLVKRRTSWMIYVKSGQEIEQFFTCVGAVESSKALREIREFKANRNETNRFVNAFMANENRRLDASMEQIRDIEVIIKKGKLDTLSPALKEFIKLRVENPDASLKEIGELCDPPLSKSAINHRSRRLSEVANKIREESNK
ncbi:MAG: DNA-binding protein WhiA [Phoenicibacter congonensis]|uniref:Probable cell division protein WhiA n=1 Tax=Phoenicibacter congonensis TaxID=1944646 RepID=A0AA43RKE8_9ACTN|nr:DNA-binding protein WhiA [Phoenicibacter congonensis]